MRVGRLGLVTLAVLLCAGACASAAADLSKAVVLTAGAAADPVERQAATMLRWEVQRRTGLDLKQAAALPAADVPAVIVGSRERMPALPAGARLPDAPMKDGKPAAEGYVLAVDTQSRTAPTVYAIGNDRRGALFAVGRLLRAVDWAQGSLRAPGDLHISSAPAYPIRGMQLGYRETNDTVDAWDVGQFAQYVRDLICFGNNSIELIPPLYPGSAEQASASPTMPIPTWDMTLALCSLLDAYDMDVWFWLPIEGDMSKPPDRERYLRQCEGLFAACSRIDAVFIPAGDPGSTPPQVLVQFLPEFQQILQKHHPKARLWLSTQGFEAEALNWFYEYLQKNQPGWLAGVVYGPWAKDSLEHTRAAVPAKYPIRAYPDITHSRNCQYPIPDWDEPWAQAYDRQPLMPRPTQMAHICTLQSPDTVGAIAYSDGVGDDLNKIVWDAYLWDPKADLREVLRDFGRCFVGPEFADGVAEGELMLEKNWTGPALASPQVPETLAHWQAMEKRAPEKALGSWRFQQGLIRAYADAYVQKRLQQETALLDRAYAELKKAPQVGAAAAMASAEAILKQDDPAAAAPELRRRVDDLAAMLFKSIGMELSVEKYGNHAVDRGALLDTVDRPLADGAWLLLEFPRIRTLSSEQEKLARLDRLVNWENAGPGGFYDDFGNGANGKEPHLVLEPGWQKDPGYVVSAQDEHGGPNYPEARLSWCNQAQTLYWTPLRMRYTGLDKNATYVLRAVPGGRFNPTMQLYFNGQKFGEPITTDKANLQVVEFEVPRSATATGALEVTWEKLTGRGPQVAEQWLIRK